MSTIRWNHMLGEWVIVTPRRAKRPFQEKEHQCPFCPGQPETSGEWDVLTLDNKFPSLELAPGMIPLDSEIVMEAPAYGGCNVIVYSRDHDKQIESLNIDQIVRVLEEYLEVFTNLDKIKGILYVYQFENRGRAIGVSLNHPHGQVYALPFIPPRINTELKQFDKIWQREERCLVCYLIEKELEVKERIINATEHYMSLVPFAARLPYEVHIYPKEHVQSLDDLKDSFDELASMIQDTVRRYDKIFEENAYVMAFHTRPSNGKYPNWHFHIEFYPPWREPNKRKYLAGLESGTWTYTNDSSPEDKAKELREAL